jgi:hypothetical protein
MSSDQSQKLADDIIWGGAGIAEELGIPVSRVYAMIHAGQLKVGRLGHRTIFISRKRLRRDLEAAQSDAA